MCPISLLCFAQMWCIHVRCSCQEWLFNVWRHTRNAKLIVSQQQRQQWCQLRGSLLWAACFCSMVTLNRTVCHACHSRVFCLWGLLCSVFIHFPLNLRVKAITSKYSTCTSPTALFKFALQILKVPNQGELVSSGAKTRGKHFSKI